MATGEIRSSQVSINYLHSNSTSHVWPFSAIAELIDNAYDPDVSAKEMYIDKRVIQGKVCLTLLDNGSGMNPDELHRMLSFGFSDKKSVGEHKPVGRYGNGFKSGSMRLGDDAIVFTKQVDTMSVGLLSQTYLKEINAKTVLVPIVSWKRQIFGSLIQMLDSGKKDLLDICLHSPFKTENDLLKELEDMKDFTTGTKIIIYNLKRDSSEMLELDFSSDPNDIRDPRTSTLSDTSETQRRDVGEQLSKYKVSLREYCRILFYIHRMDIFVREKKVRPMLFKRNLLDVEQDVYRPKYSKDPITIMIGFAQPKLGEPSEYGLVMYYKNRLIKAYEKIGFQKQANDLGDGVVIVVDASCLTPTHNKQDFNRDEKYTTFIANMESKLKDYWREKRGNGSESMKEEGTIPSVGLWVQCDSCNKYRRLPVGVKEDDLPNKWFCYMNLDLSHNRCEIPQEKHIADEYEVGKVTYKKTNKKKAKEEEEMRRLVENEAKVKQKLEEIQTEKLQSKVTQQKMLEASNNINISEDLVRNLAQCTENTHIPSFPGPHLTNGTGNTKEIGQENNKTSCCSFTASDNLPSGTLKGNARDTMDMKTKDLQSVRNRATPNKERKDTRLNLTVTSAKPTEKKDKRFNIKIKCAEPVCTIDKESDGITMSVLQKDGQENTKDDVEMKKRNTQEVSSNKTLKRKHSDTSSMSSLDEACFVTTPEIDENNESVLDLTLPDSDEELSAPSSSKNPKIKQEPCKYDVKPNVAEIQEPVTDPSVDVKPDVTKLQKQLTFPFIDIKPDLDKLKEMKSNYNDKLLRGYKTRLYNFVKNSMDLLKRMDTEKHWASPENVKAQMHALARDLNSDDD